MSLCVRITNRNTYIDKYRLHQLPNQDALTIQNLSISRYTWSFATAQSRRMDCQDPQGKRALTKAELWSNETMMTTRWQRRNKYTN